MNLDTLLQRPDVWRAGQVSATVKAVPSGFAELDAQLAGGGWPRGALTELIMPRQGIGALRLLMPALAQLSQDDRWICWVAPPHIPYAPALVSAGIDLSRVLLVHPKAQQDGLWAVEQSLRSGNCSAVLAWPTLEDNVILRRLQLAAEAGDALGFLFRSRRYVQRPSPAALRLQLEPEIGGSLSVSILKRRGGRATGSIYLDTSLQHDSLALHSRTPTAAGHSQPQWQ
ncbi:MAG: translesion DNA synthesis-associated protein ImuA [Gammaproteobacteria bacterium]|nr:MAG: translesion DNA synthesis-associated protein ImuA [Gammaproteobacteria bacterium]